MAALLMGVAGRASRATITPASWSTLSSLRRLKARRDFVREGPLFVLFSLGLPIFTVVLLLRMNRMPKALERAMRSPSATSSV